MRRKQTIRQRVVVARTGDGEMEEDSVTSVCWSTAKRPRGAIYASERSRMRRLQAAASRGDDLRLVSPHRAHSTRRSATIAATPHLSSTSTLACSIDQPTVAITRPPPPAARPRSPPQLAALGNISEPSWTASADSYIPASLSAVTNTPAA